MMIRALVAAATALAHITLFSASSASAYYSFYDYSNYCNKQQCCWALNVNHWDIRNICYGCEGQDVCNLYTPRTPRPTPRPTKNPTNTNVAWRNDGWNNDGYGDSRSGVEKNYCCQTTGNCPIDTPVVTHRQWLDRAQGVRLKYCCQRSISAGRVIVGEVVVVGEVIVMADRYKHYSPFVSILICQHHLQHYLRLYQQNHHPGHR